MSNTFHQDFLNAGFEIGGSNEGGVESYNYYREDGSVIVVGRADWTWDYAGWDYEIYPTREDYENGTNRTPNYNPPHTSANDLINHLVNIGLIAAAPEPIVIRTTPRY